MGLEMVRLPEQRAAVLNVSSADADSPPGARSNAGPTYTVFTTRIVAPPTPGRSPIDPFPTIESRGAPPAVTRLCGNAVIESTGHTASTAPPAPATAAAAWHLQVWQDPAFQPE